MSGITGGFFVGAARYVVGASIPTACNWAVATFILGGMAGREYCKTKKRAEHARIQDLKDKYEAERARVAASQAAKRKEAAEAKLAEAEKSRRWYKFW